MSTSERISGRIVEELQGIRAEQRALVAEVARLTTVLEQFGHTAAAAIPPGTQPITAALPPSETSDAATQEFDRRSLRPYFARGWYLHWHARGWHARLRPWQHYLRKGWKQAASPNPLFDVAWYLHQNPDVAAARAEPLEHYVRHGWREGRQPCPLFAPQWYLERNPDIAAAGMEPLLHYLTHGWREGRQPHPAFDLDRYLRMNPDVHQAGVEPLTHYLTEGWREGRSPHALFDPAWYLRQHVDVELAGTEPLTHYLATGWRRRYSPTPQLHTEAYTTAHPEVDWTVTNPLVHLIEQGSLAGPRDDAGWLDAIEPSTRASAPPAVQAIAMYLPQFHRIPENDAWWGEGFTEWTNVRRGRPLFAGHYQPHVPHPEVGYYDLDDETVLERQAALARRYGIHGFCFYHYWFSGRRLLEKPLERLLRSGRPDFPFCVCWANENWTRTWDGLEREVLMRQDYTPENDERFIRELLPALTDPRYIRVEDRPLLAVYRPALLGDPAATAARWRAIARAEGLGDLHLVAVHSFDRQDPRTIGFDAAMQFPPLQIPSRNRARDRDLAAEPGHRGHVFDYRDAVRHSLGGDPVDYTLYRGVMPSWDNTARRMERGTAWIHSSPELYGRWLHSAAEATRRELPATRQFVFINAWNEWAEGAHLEPDQKHGHRFLEETARALTAAAVPESPARPARHDGARPTSMPAAIPAADAWKTDLRILVVSHDACLAGAQNVTLRTIREWKRAGLQQVRIVCVGDGVLRGEFEALYPTVVLADHAHEADRRRALLEAADFGPGPAPIVYSSTVVNGPVLAWLTEHDRDKQNLRIVTHAHELQKSIERWAPGATMEATLRHTDAFLAAAPSIAANLSTRHGVPQVDVVAAHIDCDSRGIPGMSREMARAACGAEPDDILVFGCGTTDWRKGPDLFCRIAAATLPREPRLRFVWIGGDPAYGETDPEWRALAERVRFLGPRDDARSFLGGGDLFLLSSREDPMPLVALEAAHAGLPVVCFAGAGDIPDALGPEAAAIVAMEDVAAAADQVVALATDTARRTDLGDKGRQRVLAGHDSRRAAAVTLAHCASQAGASQAGATPSSVRVTAAQILEARPLVSVIVPNYNHARYLPARLESIRGQTVTDLEILLLDDCSTDGSLTVLEDFCRREPRARLVRNPRNSGSTFRQWAKGLAAARGRYVWIAESDDAAEPHLLERLVAALEAADRTAGSTDPATVLAYCQSMMIDEKGDELGIPYAWTDDLGQDRWRTAYRAAGHDEIRQALLHKNTIPNVSAVLFRNDPHLAALVATDMRLCGDWMLYTRLCGRGNVAFVPEALNLWRQRSSNARTRPAGELEWTEGRHVIREAATLLGLTDRDTERALALFRARCEAWREMAAA